jgi:protein arginine N-methyltransferase 1
MNGVYENGGGAAGVAVRAIPGKADKAADFANYFCTYAFLYHQKEMLSDRVRMDAYYDSICRNTRHFKGKVRVPPHLLLPLVSFGVVQFS